MRAYIDSDILIWHLRGERKASSFLRRLSKERGTDLWTGALQRAEIVFFMRESEEVATMSFLSRFKIETVTQGIVDTAAGLYRKYHPSHGTDINDAILAATAWTTGGSIYTLNMKHYPMREVAVIKGW